MAGLTSAASAQICAGTPSLATNSLRVGGTAMISSNHSKAYGGNAALAVHEGWYLGGNFTHATADNTDGSSNGGGGSLSYEWPTVFSGGVHVCSTVGAYTQEGSLVGDFPLPANNPQNTLDLFFGGSLGWVASTSGSMQIIPSLGAGLIHRSNTYKIVNQGAANPTRSYNFGVVTGSIGFAYSHRWTVSPMVTVPISEYKGKPSYGVGLSYQLDLSHLSM